MVNQRKKVDRQRIINILRNYKNSWITLNQLNGLYHQDLNMEEAISSTSIHNAVERLKLGFKEDGMRVQVAKGDHGNKITGLFDIDMKKDEKETEKTVDILLKNHQTITSMQNNMDKKLDNILEYARNIHKNQIALRDLMYSLKK